METRIGNVAREADVEFLRFLKNEDSKRYESLMRNMRREQPTSRLPEEQALTNFMLGLPTGQWRFEIIAGDPAPLPATLPEGNSSFTQRPFRPATVDRGGRPRKFKTNAERQKAYRWGELKGLPQNAHFAAGNHQASTSYEGVL
jgi:hypothetical protein